LGTKYPTNTQILQSDSFFPKNELSNQLCRLYGTNLFRQSALLGKNLFALSARRDRGGKDKGGKNKGKGKGRGGDDEDDEEHEESADDLNYSSIEAEIENVIQKLKTDFESIRADRANPSTY
jgi:hypothetical protein